MKLLHDTRVNFPAGTELEVSEAEASRLQAFGLAEEVKSLMDMGFTSSDVAMKGIGYKEIIDAVNRGEAPESAAETIKLNTRHYARRQMIWLRRYPQIKWVSPEYDSEKIAF